MDLCANRVIPARRNPLFGIHVPIIGPGKQRFGPPLRDTAILSSRVSYRFVLSLPERLLRSLSAVSGGLLREIGAVAVPARIRRTALYGTLVEVALRFLIQEVGQVPEIYPSEGRLAQDF